MQRPVSNVKSAIDTSLMRKLSVEDDSVASEVWDDPNQDDNNNSVQNESFPE